MTIYIDIGNTSIKINFDNKHISFPTKSSYSIDSFYSKLPDYLKDDVTKVLLCSVVPSKKTLIEGVSKKYWGLIPIVIAYPLKTGIKIKADNPKVVGADIVCLAAYAGSRHENSIIVNMGTATTITHVVNNAIQGVIILPGFMTSLSSLISGSAKISEISIFIPNGKVIGNNTEESISIGMVKGHMHMIRGLVLDISKDAKLIISGGNSKSVDKFLPEFELIKEATIEGMKVIEKIN